MINPLQTHAELSAACFRVAGFAWANQLKILQLMADALIEAPFAPVRALHKAAAVPAAPKASKNRTTRKPTVGDAGEVVVKATKRAKVPGAPVIEPTPVEPVKPKVAAKPKTKAKAAKASVNAEAPAPEPVAKKIARTAVPKVKTDVIVEATPKAEEVSKPTRRKTRAPSKPPAMPAPGSDS